MGASVVVMTSCRQVLPLLPTQGLPRSGMDAGVFQQSGQRHRVASRRARRQQGLELARLRFHVAVTGHDRSDASKSVQDTCNNAMEGWTVSLQRFMAVRFLPGGIRGVERTIWLNSSGPGPGITHRASIPPVSGTGYRSGPACPSPRTARFRVALSGYGGRGKVWQACQPPGEGRTRHDSLIFQEPVTCPFPCPILPGPGRSGCSMC